MESYPCTGGWERMGKKLQGIRGINGSYKIDRGRLRIVQEMEKPNNLYVQLMNITERVDAGGRGLQGGGE